MVGASADGQLKHAFIERADGFACRVHAVFGLAHPDLNFQPTVTQQVHHVTGFCAAPAFVHHSSIVDVQITWTPKAAKSCFGRTLDQVWVALRVHVDQRHEPFGHHATFGRGWKSGWSVGMIACEASLLYGAIRTTWRSRRAHGGAQFHHRLIPHARCHVLRMSDVHPRLSQGRDVAGRGLERRRLPCHDATYVAVDHGRRHLVRNGGDGSGGVRADAGQPLERGDHVFGGRR